MVVKDGAVPGGSRTRNALRNALALAGLTACSRQNIAADGVSFTMWICRVVD